MASVGKSKTIMAWMLEYACRAEMADLVQALVASCSWEIEDEQLKTRISVAYLTSLLEVDQEGQPNLTEAKLEEALDRFKRIAPKENGPVHLSHSFFLSTAMIVQVILQYIKTPDKYKELVDYWFPASDKEENEVEQIYAKLRTDLLRLLEVAPLTGVQAKPKGRGRKSTKEKDVEWAEEFLQTHSWASFTLGMRTFLKKIESHYECRESFLEKLERDLFESAQEMSKGLEAEQKEAKEAAGNEEEADVPVAKRKGKSAKNSAKTPSKPNKSQEAQNLRQTRRALNARGEDPLDEALEVAGQAKRKNIGSDTESDDEEPVEKKRSRRASDSHELRPRLPTPEPKRKPQHHQLNVVANASQRKSDGMGPRRRWTDEEVDNLIKGVTAHGQGNWATILSNFSFEDRSSVDLKDKWRNLQKIGIV